MFNLAALIRALPRSALAPAALAWLDGFIEEPKDSHGSRDITLLEPPAGLSEPCIEPIQALTLLLRGHGMAPQQAQSTARAAVARMHGEVTPDRWVRYFDHQQSDPSDCLPVSDFLDGLHTASLGMPADVLDFLGHAAQVAVSAPLFLPFGERRVVPMNRVALRDLPARPRPKEWFSFFHAPWCDDLDEAPGWDAAFMAWRETMRPIAQELAQTLGQPLYHFDDHELLPDDPEEEGQFDCAHRFFILHWCCTYRPDSGFVRHLLQASGARHVDELKAALIAPASYADAFDMDTAHNGYRSTHSRSIRYLPPQTRRTLVVVFSTVDARDVAEMVLQKHIGVHVRFVAPAQLATPSWMRRAARHCRSWQCWPMQDGWLQRPIALLAAADEVLVIADDDRSGIHLNLSDAAQDLLWLAIEMGANHHYHFIDGWGLGNPKQTLRKHGAPQRMALRQAERAALTQQLTEIRLRIGFGAGPGKSGLCDRQGRDLAYDQIDLPLALLRRIAAWQRDCVAAGQPSCPSRDLMQRALEQEQIEIARALRHARDWKVLFKPPGRQDWLDIDQVDGPGNGDGNNQVAR